MKARGIFLLCTVACVGLGGCNKQSNGTAASSAPANPPATAAPTSNAPAGPAVASSAATTGTGDNAALDETAAKLSGVDWALKKDEIKNDAKGQWATDASASTTYNDAAGKAAWSAEQTTGPPDVDKYGDDGHAWAPKTQDAGIEWIDLKYAKPVHASEIRVRESCGSGAVVKVEAFDEQGTAHQMWKGIDPTRELNYLVVKFPKTSYKVNRVRVTLATNIIPGWNEIDAVQLVGSD